MNISKKASLIVLAITALILSRAMFSFFNDPEGPNLLIVTVMAAVIFFLSTLAYLFKPTATYLKKLLLGGLIQILVVSIFYFFLK